MTDNKSMLIKIIVTVAGDTGVDPFLALAICEHESSLNPWATRYETDFFTRYVQPLSINRIQAISPYVKIGLPTVETERRALSTSFGLMQIMGMSAREAGFDGQWLTELCDPFVGVRFGCLLLKSKIDKYGMQPGIAAYNSGKPVYSGKKFKNQEYVDSVQARQEKWREELKK